MPITSHEVRWFFPGELGRFSALRRSIETARPFPHEDGAFRAPIQRIDPAPDVYLLIPGADDLSIRWRGNQLQVKGRLSHFGLQRFAHRFYGAVDAWTSWAECGTDGTRQAGAWPSREPGGVWQTATVRKIRRLRKTRLTPHRQPLEVAGDASPDRVLNVELTDLEVNGSRYCSLALKAYPSDAAMPEAFTDAANTWLATLTDPQVVLAEHQSMGYPEFLRRRAQIQAI